MTNSDPEDLKDQYLEETDAEEGNVESVVPSDRDVIGILKRDGTYDDDGEDGDDEDLREEDGEDSLAARDDGLSNIGSGIPGNRDLPNSDDIIEGDVVVDDMDEADEGVSAEAMAAEGLTVNELRDDAADAIVDATLASDTLNEADSVAESVVNAELARNGASAATSDTAPAKKPTAKQAAADAPKKSVRKAKAPSKPKAAGKAKTPRKAG